MAFHSFLIEKLAIRCYPKITNKKNIIGLYKFHLQTLDNYVIPMLFRRSSWQLVNHFACIRLIRLAE